MQHVCARACMILRYDMYSTEQNASYAHFLRQTNIWLCWASCPVGSPVSGFNPQKPGPKAQSRCAGRAAVGVATPEFSTLAVSRAFAMPAGRAFKPPGPASFELNTTNHSVILSAPLAPLPTRSAFYRRNFQVPRRYQHDLSVEHDGLHGGDLRVQLEGGEAGPKPRIQLDRRSSSSSRATTRTVPRSPGRRGLRAGDKASGHWRPQLIYGTGCVLKEDTCEAGDHGLSAPSGAPMAWGISCSLGRLDERGRPNESEAPRGGRAPHGGPGGALNMANRF